jgi:hypothetical protein
MRDSLLSFHNSSEVLLKSRPSANTALMMEFSIVWADQDVAERPIPK